MKNDSLGSLKNMIAPILAFIFSMLANGYLMTITAVRQSELEINEIMLGINAAAYFLGMGLGSFKSATFIIRVGHIRAYAAFASILAVSAILQGLFVNVYFWIILRLICGLCIAGIFIVIESWLINFSTPQTRGKFLAFYMLVLYGAYSLGQLLINFSAPEIIRDFALIGAIICFSIFPMMATKSSSPQIDEPDAVNIKSLLKINPTGVFGCLFSGLVVSSTVSILPYHLEASDFTNNQIGQLMFFAVIGGTLLQYPIGIISDKTDRRTVIFSSAITLIIISILLLTLSKNIFILSFLLFMLGGCIFSIYTVSISHVCDFIKNENIVSVIQGLVLIYSAGCIVGPLISTIFIKFFNSKGLFVYLAVISIVYALFTIYRKIKVEHVADKFKNNFIPTPATTSILSGLDPRSEDIENIEETPNEKS